VLDRTTGAKQPEPDTVLDAAALLALQATVHDVPLPDNVKKSILKLTHSSRPQDELADDYVKKYVSWGAGPRASQTLVRAARALALLRGRESASLEEVKAVAPAVLRHRVIANYNATGEGITVEDIVKHLLAKL
jgi:MoxR-like ATPase